MEASGSNDNINIVMLAVGVDNTRFINTRDSVRYRGDIWLVSVKQCSQTESLSLRGANRAGLTMQQGSLELELNAGNRQQSQALEHQ